MMAAPVPRQRCSGEPAEPGSVRWQERFYPLPNFGGPNLINANYRDAVPQQIRHDQFDVRVDYALKSNNNLYAREL